MSKQAKILAAEGGDRGGFSPSANGGAAPPAAPDPEGFARSYQLECLDIAKKRNTIAFLDTGSGKTLIAVMLIRSYAHLIRRRPSGGPSSIAVFLVPTVVLVSQQADVIQMHSDFKVGRFWGDMGVDFWSETTWKEKLDAYEVFVMTPQILLDNLRHSFFKLDDIKLLIFDECHHARGKHPYACIMTEFYHQQLFSGSPCNTRIFGMTASLINTKDLGSRVAYEKKILELETLMNSKVYTVANESVLAEYISFSTPKIRLYKHVGMPYSLDLILAGHLKMIKYKHLCALENLNLDASYKENVKNKLSKLNATFIFCITELGSWLAWKAAEKLSCKEYDIYFWGQAKDGLGEKAVRNFSRDVTEVFSQYFPPGGSIGKDVQAAMNGGFLTTKVECLLCSLLEYRGMQNLRCIIFVERVITAIVLQSLLSLLPELSGWGTKYMAGNSSGLQSQSRKDHLSTVDSFRDGKINIIVATQILEEGLDVQSCNLVVRFDPCPTVSSFIQSRGRARMQGSDYVLIIRSGDSSAISRVNSYLKSGDVMREETLQLSSFPCAPLENEMCTEEFYRVEATGAIVTLSSSIPLIYVYCSRLPSDGYFKPLPRFRIEKESNMCMLYLPNSCHIPAISVQGKSSMLKQYACLEACKRLHQCGALTNKLLPVIDVEEEATTRKLENCLSTNSEQFDIYFPEELVDSWSSFSVAGLYYTYKIGMSADFISETSFTDVVLVVKSHLGSEFSSMSFNLAANQGDLHISIDYLGTIQLNPEQVSKARRFQTAVLNILIHDDFDILSHALNLLSQDQFQLRIAYLLLPAVKSGNHFSIDSKYLRPFIFSNETTLSHRMLCNAGFHNCSLQGACREIPIKNGKVHSCMIKNSIVYTPHNKRIYCVTGILKLNGHSLMEKDGVSMTYEEYFRSRHGISLSQPKECLLSGWHIFHAQNFLVKRLLKKGKVSRNAAVELPPELCVVILSQVNLSVLYSYSFLPSIMCRIESMLLVGSINIESDHCMQNDLVPAVKVMEAITTKKCREQFSLESLEMLGDSYLKYVASLHLFKANKHHHEGILSTKKERMVQNATLYDLGCNRKLAGFIRNEEFDPKKWDITSDSHTFDKKNLITLCDSKYIYNIGLRHMKVKIVADVVEAMIGAYLSTKGEFAALSFMQWLGMEIDIKNNVPYDRQFSPKADIYVNVKALESLLKYSFKDSSLLVEALTHGSYQVPEIPACYQRLEFLGDAVLDHLITLHMFSTYPLSSPGLLTDLRSASVNNDCYAHAAVKAGLNKHILHASSELHRQITFYLANFSESFAGSSYGWDAGVALPKVLGDVIESLAGAIFVDSGYNKDIVWDCIKPLLEPLVSPDTIQLHPVRELRELCDQKGYKLEFLTTLKDGISSITVEVDVDGDRICETHTAINKKTAKKLAAKIALDALKARSVSWNRGMFNSALAPSM